MFGRSVDAAMGAGASSSSSCPPFTADFAAADAAELFQQLDKDGDGLISAPELEAAANTFCSGRAEWPAERVRATIKEHDADGDGSLTLSDFLAVKATLARPDVATVEERLIAALSEARVNPAGLAERIAARKAHFKGKDYFPPDRGGQVALPTKEGTRVIDEAVQFLRALPAPLPALSEPTEPGALEALKLSAEDHLVDRGTLGRIGHRGSDGSHSAQRQVRPAWRPPVVGAGAWHDGRDAPSARSTLRRRATARGAASAASACGLGATAQRRRVSLRTS